MRGPKPDKPKTIKPILKESVRAVEKINEFIQESDEDDNIITMRESDLKRLIVSVILQMDSNYVRKSDLKREVELILQEMVLSKTPNGGKRNNG